jgi:protein involved in polysaccharide export with SLBB domain
MFKFTTCVMAVTLAATSITASAQNSASKDDMFGQEMPSMSEPAPVQAAPGKVRIMNGPAAEQDISGRGFDASDSERAGRLEGRGGESSRGRQSAQRRAANERAFASERDSAARNEVISEFQNFMWDSTGKILPVFGSEFFANAPSSFTPIVNSPLPADHPLGPGDELLIRGTGTIDIDYRATVDRNGMISIPTVGTVVLAGVRAGDAEGVVRGAIAKLYKGVVVNVTFGRLRAITVYVVGQARRPGTYTVPSLSTTMTALFASGGPNANGSMRRVQVKRAGRTVAELDLYAFIAKGDKSSDVKLQDGDSIYIPPAGGFVGLIGMVNTRAIYELKANGDTVESVLDVAGGLPVVADRPAGGCRPTPRFPRTYRPEEKPATQRRAIRAE